MNLFRCSAIACALVFTAFAADNLPHAYPRKGATKLLENNRVTVWEVNWLNNVPQPYHRHCCDMAGVYLRYGFINVTTPEGKVNPSQPFEVPRPYFQPAGVTHKEEAVGKPGDPERLAVMIDLREPKANGVKPLDVNNPAFPREGAKDAIDNARVVEWDYTWVPKKPAGEHVFTRDSVEVIVTGGQMKRKSGNGPEQTITLKPKDARFIPRGTVETDEAVDGPIRTITFELK